jgi:hypothetical protein
LDICRNCGKEIVGKPLVIGPKKLELIYCSVKCNVLTCLKKYPDTSLANMLKAMYPGYTAELMDKGVKSELSAPVAGDCCRSKRDIYI